MKQFFLIFFSLLNFLLCNAQQKNYSQYVDPMTGTGGHGHTFPGATLPFGMVQLSPDTRIDGSWDGCSGYHYSDSVIYGFSHTHLSGTGVSDWGDILLMPTSEHSVDKKIYSSKFLHKNEKANAGYYAVKLEDDNIEVELTSTTRAGFHKYVFNNSGNKNVVLDLTHRDKTLPGSYVKVLGNHKLEGCRISQAWAQQQTVFYAIEFSQSFEFEIFIDEEEAVRGKVLKNNLYEGSNVKAIFSFNTSSGKTIYAKVGISSVSEVGAWKNLEAEIPDWNFDKTKNDAAATWDKQLSEIEVSSDQVGKLKTFYSALYHCMIHPSIASDIDGSYRGMDNKIYKAVGFNYYSVFSLWDTFRALHPLLTLIEQNRVLDIIKTFLEMYKQTGRLPVWELSSNETDCMIGYHAVSVIADAYAKGINDFDAELAMQAMVDMSNLNNYRGLNSYRKNGFLEVEDESESVSKTLEYAYDDWCIAQFANALGKDSLYKVYSSRAQSWKNIFNPETGFMQPRSNGGWQYNFDPKRVDNNFTEGNSWQYTFFVPQNIPAMIKLMGGADKFEKKMDELFSTSSKTTGREQADITGLIGQYAHGNEPSHHMAYLYNYIGKPEKTKYRVKQILDDFYKPTPDGLIGNEDCGQMSAWYVMSSMGLYAVCPGNNYFDIGLPYFNNIKINFEDGSTSAYTNKDELFKNTTVSYFAVTKKTAVKVNVLPTYEPIVISPVIYGASQVFSDSILVEIKSLSSNTKIKFSCTDLGQSETAMREYSKPFYIKSDKQIKAISESALGNSNPSLAMFYKRPNNWEINILSTYNAQYTAGGDKGIIDGLCGDENWRKGRWQGYQNQNFECVIDLGKQMDIAKLSAGFLQDTRAWILMPLEMEVSFSSDNVTFSNPLMIRNTIKDHDLVSQVKNFTLEFKQHARYVKVKAINYGKLPAWHEGAGGDAFIFIDEISIE